MNKLYYGDNLEVLRHNIADNSVDLIYLDPPFNSKANYNILFKGPEGTSSPAQITAFEDFWHWTEEAERTFIEIIKIATPQVIELMKLLRAFIQENDMLAYLTMMCIRLIELKRVLKDTGSIYLHCDPTASHYLKILMDAIFGGDNFRNEIVWCYTSGGKSTHHFAKKHDVILFYSKTKDYIFNVDAVRVPYSDKTLANYKPGLSGSSYTSKVTLNPNGKVPEDYWNIAIASKSTIEYLGYPTQKPLALLERIVKASADKNAVVLDPFCGCGTTISACGYLNKNDGYNLSWIGIDVTHLAVNLIKARLLNEYQFEQKKDYKVFGEPADVEGAKALAKLNRYQFEWWALSLINAQPWNDKKKGADSGIDGVLYFVDGNPKEPKKVIVQVKSGNVSVSYIRDFKTVVENQKAQIGIFITLNEPTRPMQEEAVKSGFYRDLRENEHRKIQIITIDELFNDKKIDVPLQLAPFKKADMVKEKDTTGDLV